MMWFHFVYTQRFPVSDSKILPIKEDRVVFYLVLETLLLLTCILCVCVHVVGMELLPHSFFYSFYNYLELIVCQACVGHGNAWVTMEVTSPCTQGAYRSK